MSKYPPFDDYMKKLKDAEKAATVSQVGTNDTKALCKIISNLFLVLNQDFANNAYGSAYVVGLRLVTVCAVLLPESLKFRSEDPSLQSQIAAATTYAKKAVDICAICKEKVRIQYDENVKAILAMETAHQLAERSNPPPAEPQTTAPDLKGGFGDEYTQGEGVPWATAVPGHGSEAPSRILETWNTATHVHASGADIPVAQPVFSYKGMCREISPRTTHLITTCTCARRASTKRLQTRNFTVRRVIRGCLFA
jgi:hypothetical protein